MPLYGGELVNVTTPDGRIVRMPADLASSFQGLVPAPQDPVTLPAGEAPSFPSLPPPEAPPPAAPAPAPVPPPIAPPEQAAAVIQPPAPIEAPPTPAVPVVEVPPAPPPPTQTPQITAKQLGKIGNADILNAEQAALDRQADAIKAAALVDADEATKIGEAQAARDAETDRILAERAAKANEFAKSMDARMAQYEADAKAIANTKIDRDIDHPILAAIGVLLGVFGGDAKPALDGLMAGIERKVQGQMQDLEIKRSGLALQREKMGMDRDANRDLLAEYDTRRLAAIDQAKSKVETIKAQSGSDRVRANSDAALAALDKERVATIGNAAQREQDKLRAEQARRDQLNAAAQARKDQAKRDADAKAERDRNFNEGVRQFNVQQEAMIAKAQQAAIAGGGEAAQKQAKEIRETGIKDPATGRLFLQPKGERIYNEQVKPLEDEANMLRSKAERETDPAKRQAMIEQADMRTARAEQNRAAIELNYAVQGRNAQDAAKTQAAVANAQTALSLIDEAKALRKKYGPQFLNTKEGQAMKSKTALLELVVKDTFELGALDAGAQEYMGKATGGDPTELRLGDVITGMGAEGPEGSLDSLAQAIESRTRNTLAGSMEGADRWRPRRDARTEDPAEAAAADIYGEQTVLEKTKGEKASGLLRKGADAITDAFGLGLGKPIEQQRVDRAKATGTVYGLTEKQDEFADANIAALKNLESSDPKTYQAATRAADRLIGFATDEKRPEARAAWLAKLRSDAPDLYDQAIARFPPDKRAAEEARVTDMLRERRAQFAVDLPKIDGPATGVAGEATRAIAGALPITAVERDAALAGDQGALQEIARRASNGDRDAIAIVQEIAARRQR